MEIEEVFKYPFKSPFIPTPFYSPIRFKNVENFLFQTEEIQASVTLEEIYKQSIDHLKAIVEEYNQHRINGERITESAYNLNLNIWDEDRTNNGRKKIYTRFIILYKRIKLFTRKNIITISKKLKVNLLL